MRSIRKSKELNPNTQPFVPKQIPSFNASQNQPYPSLDIGATLSHLVSLQAKQTELSLLLINQQKTIHLPAKEPPVFSGDSFEYPSFIKAFDSIIANNVHADWDRLFFLEKYTSGSANEEIKGFLATNPDTAYKEARKLLEQRYGNPVVVAENYKSNLRNWRQINDGDSKGLREFSDFLVHCQEAMKNMKSMAELDYSQILVTCQRGFPLIRASNGAGSPLKNKQNARTLSDLKISSSLSSKKQRLLMILYSLLTLSRENETKLLTQMSRAFVLQDQNDEVKPAQASLSFRL